MSAKETTKTTCTLFWDMHSGGGLKEPPYHLIYIELPEEKARVYFYNQFGHSPDRVTCTCCGPDYAVYESASLLEASEYHRKGSTLEEHENDGDVLIIRANEIEPSMCEGEVPKQGYVWID